MINIPGILAKESSDQVIYMTLSNSIGIWNMPRKKIPKKGTPFGSQKPCVGSTQKSLTPYLLIH